MAAAAAAAAAKSQESDDSEFWRRLPPEDDDRFIYDEWELKLINNPKSGRKPIPYVKRYRGDRQRFGIRAHRFMDESKCWFSVVIPWHNEFLPIWFQIIVVLFFWTNYILNVFHVWIYGTLLTK